MDLVKDFKKNIGDSSIFQFFREHDKYLYHYTSAETAIKYIRRYPRLYRRGYLQIPRPREKSRELLKALGIRMPMALPHREVRVVTRKKLPEQRRIP